MLVEDQFGYTEIVAELCYRWVFKYPIRRGALKRVDLLCGRLENRKCPDRVKYTTCPDFKVEPNRIQL